jgi:hypothetical protein
MITRSCRHDPAGILGWPEELFDGSGGAGLVAVMHNPAADGGSPPVSTSCGPESGRSSKISTRSSERKQVDYAGRCGVGKRCATRREQSLQRRSGQSQHRRLHVPMHSKWATRRHAVAAALAPRLKGLNITTDLMQVGKLVTGQQL